MGEESFASYVRRHRIGLDIKQDALAEMVGISQSYVSGIERGINTDISRDIVKRIAAALRRPETEALLKAGYAAEEDEGVSQSVVTKLASLGYAETLLRIASLDEEDQIAMRGWIEAGLHRFNAQSQQERRKTD